MIRRGHFIPEALFAKNPVKRVFADLSEKAHRAPHPPFCLPEPIFGKAAAFVRS
jgi:hypothetical protein